LAALKNKFSGMFSQVAGLMGAGLPSPDALLEKLEQTRTVIEQVNRQFKDPECTTFVCVCIPVSDGGVVVTSFLEHAVEQCRQRAVSHHWRYRAYRLKAAA
jgi:anion-transporting  ArsA/GET3 family ATPase